MRRLLDAVLFATVDACCYARHRRLVVRFRRRLGYWPSVAFPKRYAERMLWRKLFDRNPLFVVCSDKLAAKAFALERCPEARVAPVLWEGIDPAAIPDEALSGGVVVKASHGSNCNLFIRPGAAIDRAHITGTARYWLGRGFHRRDGEWGYAPVTPRIFVERLIQSSSPVIDINYDCCDGQVVFGYVSIGTKTPIRRAAIFDRDGRRTATDPVLYGKQESVLPADYRPPPGYFEALRLAERLSRGFDQMRCDFIVAGDAAYFCELTVYSGAGYVRHTDDTIEHQLQAAWDLRKSWFLGTPQSGWRGVYARRLRSALSAVRPTRPHPSGP